MTGFSTLRLLILSILFSCFFLLGSCNPNNTENSLANTEEKDSVAIWINWVKEHKDSSLVTKKDALEKALLFTKKNHPDTIKTKKYSEISLAYMSLGDTTSFKKLNADLIRLSNEIGDYQSLGEAYWDLGHFYRRSHPDSTYYFYNKAYENFVTADLSENAKDYPGRIQYAMARIKDDNKDYVGAERNTVNAINFYKTNNLEERLFEAYNILANIQTALGNFESAFEYHEIASNYINKSKAHKQFKNRIFNQANKALTYSESGNYQRAKEILDNVLKIDSFKIKIPKTYARTLSSLANYKLKNGDQNLDSIIKLIDESDVILDSLGGLEFDKARNREYKALAFIAKEDTLGAIQEAKLAKTIAEQTNNNDRLLSTLKLLSSIDKKNSALYSSDYFELNESLHTQERNIRDKFARIQLETDEALQENESLARQTKMWFGVALALLLIGLSIFTIIQQRNNNQKLKFEQKQQESNQEIYDLMLSQQAKVQEGKQMEQKRVSQELHDGILGQMLGIRLILSGLNERNDEAATTQRAELIEKLQEVEEEIRTISHELNDASYQKIHNFIIAIEDLVKTIGASAQLQSSFYHDECVDWDALDGEIKINIYRIVQECLQNCVKHAQCNQVEVDFKSTNDCLTISVIDDGRGFEKNRGKNGIGMKNIKSRITKMSGSLQIDSARGKGTKITIRIPQPAPAPKKFKPKTVLEV